MNTPTLTDEQLTKLSKGEVVEEGGYTHELAKDPDESIFIREFCRLYGMKTPGLNEALVAAVEAYRAVKS